MKHALTEIDTTHRGTLESSSHLLLLQIYETFVKLSDLRFVQASLGTVVEFLGHFPLANPAETIASSCEAGSSQSATQDKALGLPTIGKCWHGDGQVMVCKLEQRAVPTVRYDN